MRRENDLEQTFVDICVLYELALAAGGSLDLEENCERFLTVLMARRGFAFASVWLRSDRLPRRPGKDPVGEPVLRRIRRVPSQRRTHLELPLTHPAWRRSQTEGAFSLQSDAPEFRRFVEEEFAVKGAIAVFPLGDLGFLHVHAPRRETALDEIELAQIETVAAKFRATLEGSLAHAKAVLEIAERERAEGEREALREQLHQSRKLEAVGRLAGGIAHDFNNLLVAVMGNAELLLDEAPAGSDLRSGLESIVQAAQRASELTSRLLEFARKEQPRPEPVRLDALVSEVCALLRRTLDPRVEIELDLQAADLVVIGDASQLHTALVNLAANARDAMPSGGKLLLCTRETAAPTANELGHEPEARTWIEVVVSDSGCGMPAEVVERAFEPFFTTKPLGEGTGLGLAAVFGIVRAHGGLARLVSEPEHGTRVHLVLPARRGDTAVDRAPAERSAAPAAATGTVLVVDDDQLARSTTARIVQRAGWTALQAGDGLEALELVRAHRARLNVVLTDMRMPRMDGNQLLRELRVLAPDLPVVVLTGFSEHTELRRLEATGIVRALAKPYSNDELLGAIEPFRPVEAG